MELVCNAADSRNWPFSKPLLNMNTHPTPPGLGRESLTYDVSKGIRTLLAKREQLKVKSSARNEEC